MPATGMSGRRRPFGTMEGSSRAPPGMVVAVLLVGSTAFFSLPTHSFGQQTWPTTLVAESDPSLYLGRVTGLAVDSRGRVYVVDVAWDGILILAPNLTFEQEVGRKGEGPGEFQWPATVQVLAGDSLYVFDGSLARATVFEPQALTVAYTVQLPPVNNPHSLWRIAGQRGYLGVRSPPVIVGQGERDDQNRLDIVFSLGTDGQMGSDSIYSMPSVEDLIVRQGGGVIAGEHPYGSEPFLRLLGDDRLVHANSRFPSVTILNIDGTMRHSFAVPANQTPVSPAELRARIESEPVEAFRRALEQGAPYVWPTLTGLIVDDEQRIWVGTRSESMSDQRQWTAFTEGGDAVGSVILPATFDLHAARDSRLFGVTDDEMGVPRIYVYRIDRE